MMNISNHELRTGSLHDFELRKESRKFTGYTLFLSFFYLEWKTLTEEGRLHEIGFAYTNDGYDSESEDDSSIESLPSILNVDVIRHAAQKWNGQAENRKKSWSSREDRLNAQPVLGKFKKFPPSSVMDCFVISSLGSGGEHARFCVESF